MSSCGAAGRTFRVKRRLCQEDKAVLLLAHWLAVRPVTFSTNTVDDESATAMQRRRTTVLLKMTVLHFSRITELFSVESFSG